MEVTRKSAISGITRTRDLPITIEQINKWQAGTMIQSAFPELSVGDREFLLSGITQEEWDKVFGSDK